MAFIRLDYSGSCSEIITGKATSSRFHDAWSAAVRALLATGRKLPSRCPLSRRPGRLPKVFMAASCNWGYRLAGIGTEHQPIKTGILTGKLDTGLPRCHELHAR